MTVIPRNPAQRGAYQDGYDARLRGCSLYANPYDPDAPGWTGSFGHAWADGWLAADETVPAWAAATTDYQPEETAV